MIKNSIANSVFMFGPFLCLATCLVFSSPPLTLAILVGCYFFGFTMLVAAKISLFQKGIWFSFGLRRMDAHNRKLYLQSYGWIIAGCLVNVIAFFTVTVFG